jgi:hypothetical protein
VFDEWNVNERIPIIRLVEQRKTHWIFTIRGIRNALGNMVVSTYNGEKVFRSIEIAKFVYYGQHGINGLCNPAATHDSPTAHIRKT